MIVDGPDPGFVQGDETESDLDVEWAGATAPGAMIDFVTSESTEASLGVDLSAQYIVDNNVAPILSESYGICELFLGTAGNQFYNQLWQQATIRASLFSWLQEIAARQFATETRGQKEQRNTDFR